MRFSMLLIYLLFSIQLPAQEIKGFDISNALVPIAEIRDGGPPRDGIPSIDTPVFITAEQAGLQEDERVLGVVYNGMAKAYPVRILNYHEIVNDTFRGKPLLITYCPLCGSGMAFSPAIKNVFLEFGVSGLLYNSDMLLYDRQTESLWSQLGMRAISGPMAGRELEFLPTAHTTWKKWSLLHPETLVLSEDTGFSRDYSKNPYPGYESSPRIFFPVRSQSDAYPPKEKVLGLKKGDAFRAYPFSELRKNGTRPIRDTFRGSNYYVEYDPEHESAEVRDTEGELVPAVTTFWFAWYAFHPDTEIFLAD